MFYLRIGPKKARLIFIALLILVAIALLFCTSEKGVIKSCYDDADERRNFIRVHGFETAEDYTVKTVTIPLVWSDVYENYNKLQLSADFDLRDYKGKAVQVYTYNCDGERNVNLMIYNGRLIGGDVSETSLGGSMKALVVDESGKGKT